MNVRLFPALLFFAAASVAGYAQTAPRAHSAVSHSPVSARRGYLGVGVGDLTAERARALKLPADGGVEVKRVDENSPAEKAGLKENDAILEMNARKVLDIEQFIGEVGQLAPGAKVNLIVWRNGAKRAVTATLDARPMQFFVFSTDDDPLPPMPPMPPPSIHGADGGGYSFVVGESPRLGLEGETLTPQLAAYFGVREGVLVRTVSAKTAAEKAGLRAGDVIVKVGGMPVNSTREISGLIRASHKTVVFTVVRNRREMTLNVEIAKSESEVFERDAM